MDTKPILLVEDEVNDVILTRRAFKKSGIVNPLIVVEDGQEAIDYMFGMGSFAGRDATDIPALILLDIKLPKIDGLSVLRAIRSDPRTRRTPIVIMTSSAAEKDLAAGYDGGVNSYMCKPVSLDRLVEVMGILGMYWLLLNQVPPKVEV